MGNEFNEVVRQIFLNFKTDGVLGLRAALRTDLPEGTPAAAAQFEDAVWNWDLPASGSPSVPSGLVEAVSREPRKAVFVDTVMPFDANKPKRISIRTEQGTYKDSAVLVHECLTRFPPSTLVCFLSFESLVIGEAASALRSEIDQRHGVHWIVYSDERLIGGSNAQIRFILLLVEVQRPNPVVRRLVDLRKCEKDRWEKELRRAAKREGGESGSAIVLRQVSLGNDPWTFERFSKAYSASRKDSEAIGRLVPLRELVDGICSGMPKIHAETHVINSSEEEDAPQDCIPLIGITDIKPNQLTTSSRQWVRDSDVPSKYLIQAGDVLFRKFLPVDTNGPRLSAATVPENIKATFSCSVIRLRWRADIPKHAQELLLSYLNSDRASEAIVARGIRSQLLISALQDLDIPYPSESLIEALGELKRIEEWYIDRQKLVRRSRQRIFNCTVYADAVSEVILTQKCEKERLTAADDSQSFGYKVRNYYPHPFALRREQLILLPHGKERVDKILECAEYLVHFLAVIGLLQLEAADETYPKEIKERQAKGELRFDWGTSWDTIIKAVAATKKHPDSLTLPFPQLEFLVEILGGESTSFSVAEKNLRKWRNDQSHLIRLPEAELRKMSEDFTRYLDCVFSSVDFLADIPLVLVRDYWLKRDGQGRRVQFEYLQGHSTAFKLSQESCCKELPRGGLGLIGSGDDFLNLTPWLMHKDCALCKRPEIFLFSKSEKDIFSYSAMETGHPLEVKPRPDRET